MRLVAKLVMVAVSPALVLSLLFSPLADDASAEYKTGKGWKYQGAISIEGEVLVADAWVIQDDGTYRMWYTRLRLDETFEAIADRITGLTNVDKYGRFVAGIGDGYHHLCCLLCAAG